MLFEILSLGRLCSFLQMRNTAVGYHPPFQDVFMFVVPINIPLCILVLAVCSIVLTYYWRNRGTLTNTLFLLITAADLITCVGHLILMICCWLMSRDIIQPHYSHISATVCVVIHTLLSLLGYASSILLNMILAVLRTVKISFPFHQVKVGPLMITVTLLVCILVVLSVIDVWFAIYESLHNAFFLWGFLWRNVEISFVGHNLWNFISFILHHYISWKSQFMIKNLLAGWIYLAPIGVVMICLVTQFIVTWHRARARDPDQPVVTDWSRVNTTVSIISAVFLVCNSGIAVLQIYYQVSSQDDYPDSFAWSVCKLMISTTLPLMNALLTPLIILARSRDLRRNVMMMIRRALRFPPTAN